MSRKGRMGDPGERLVDCPDCGESIPVSDGKVHKERYCDGR